MTSELPLRPEIVIAVSGGVVTGVFTDLSQARITVIDWDDVHSGSGRYSRDEFPHDNLKSMPAELQEILNT